MHHHRREFLRLYLLALGEVTDLIVLTERAEKIAGTEKDRPRTACADERGFFPKVGVKARHSRSRTGAAETVLPGQTVDLAVAGTQLAVLQ
jgi:hypothetical protein